MAEAKGLFGKPKAAGASSQKPLKTADTTSMSNLSTRMRILEERLFNIQKKMQVREENLLESNKEYTSEIKSLTREVAELKEQLMAMKDELENIADELEGKANESDFLVFKKYIELWKPVNFITQRDVERVVKEALNKFKYSEDGEGQ